LSLDKIKEPYRSVIEKLLELLSTMGDKLVSVVIFGSVARGSARRDSDIDLLIVAESLPKSRMERQKLFLLVEEPLGPLVNDLWEKGFHIDFSPIILSVEEASKIRPIYLDMVEDSIILYDKDDFFKKTMGRLRKRLEELGSKRVWIGEKWYWVLKPDIKFGEAFEIE
jgi:predicted nucleotidyltransferase